MSARSNRATRRGLCPLLWEGSSESHI